MSKLYEDKTSQKSKYSIFYCG